MGLSVEAHWLHEARRVPSPNADERPADCVPDLIVVHAISLPPGQYGGQHIEAFFGNKLDSSAHPYFAEIATLEVSAHLLIKRDGEIVQFVPFDRRAWHAGRSCFQGREACNDFSIGIELEGCDEDSFEAVQYSVLVDVIRALVEQYPGLSTSHIVGHNQIAPDRKTDPGPCFEWNRLGEAFGVALPLSLEANMGAAGK